MKLAIAVLLGAALLAALAFQNVWLFFVGYIWTSILYPSGFLEGYLDYIPLTFMFGLFSVLSYFAIDKLRRTHLPYSFYFALLFFLWTTLTTTGAVLQEGAWDKWRWAGLSILIAVMTPLYLRSRAQVEIGYAAILSALSAHVMTAGIKTFLGTGGYDRLGRLIMNNSWLGETSTLALASVLTIPMAWYFAKQSAIFQTVKQSWRNIAAAGYSLLSLMCLVGTSARTGLLALATLLIAGIRGLRARLLATLVIAVLALVGQSLLPSRSVNRFQTLQNYQQDSSAETRIAVWRWAIDYANEHPAGGGFTIFNQSIIHWTITDSKGRISEFTQYGRAAHSIYFEVLAEQGYFGLGLFILMLLSSALGCLRLARKHKSSLEGWLPNLAHSLFACIAIFCVGGAFVGIAYQPLIYCFVGLYGSLCGLAKGSERARIASSRAVAGFAR